jgi:CheY-like chemotaxis protein
LLTDEKATVHAVDSVAEALQVLQYETPDVLVSDLAMPEEDGFSLIDRIRNIEAKTGRHLPAIALTAYVRIEDTTCLSPNQSNPPSSSLLSRVWWITDPSFLFANRLHAESRFLRV